MRALAIALAVLSLTNCLASQSGNDSDRNVIVESVSVTPDSDISSANLDVMRLAIQNQSYARDNSGEIAERARYALQTKGYFKAEVNEAETRHLKESALETTIAVTLAVHQGQRYRLKEITFSDNTAFSSIELRGMFSISDGDLFDTEKIRLGLEELRKSYAAKGYINFIPVPNTLTDDTALLVSLNIESDEGGQFRFGELVIAGEEPNPGVGEGLIAAWHPYMGKIFDKRIIGEFWRKHLAPVLPPQSTIDHATEISTDREHHIVTLRVYFP